VSDESSYKERSHCVDVHIVRGALSNYFLKDLRPLDLAFSLKNTLSSQLLLNPLEVIMKLDTKKDYIMQMFVL
jgi:hypothetical protein